MLGVPCNCVEFVVTHDDPGSTCIHHVANERDRVELVRASVNEIADEHSDPVAVRPSAKHLHVPHLMQ
jgi:hypothetical protein